MKCICTGACDAQTPPAQTNLAVEPSLADNLPSIPSSQDDAATTSPFKPLHQNSFHTVQSHFQSLSHSPHSNLSPLLDYDSSSSSPSTSFYDSQDRPPTPVPLKLWSSIRRLFDALVPPKNIRNPPEYAPFFSAESSLHHLSSSNSTHHSSIDTQTRIAPFVGSFRRFERRFARHPHDQELQPFSNETQNDSPIYSDSAATYPSPRIPNPCAPPSTPQNPAHIPTHYIGNPKDYLPRPGYLHSHAPSPPSMHLTLPKDPLQHHRFQATARRVLSLPDADRPTPAPSSQLGNVALPQSVGHATAEIIPPKVFSSQPPKQSTGVIKVVPAVRKPLTSFTLPNNEETMQTSAPTIPSVKLKLAAPGNNPVIIKPTRSQQPQSTPQSTPPPNASSHPKKKSVAGNQTLSSRTLKIQANLQLRSISKQRSAKTESSSEECMSSASRSSFRRHASEERSSTHSSQCNGVQMKFTKSTTPYPAAKEQPLQQPKTIPVLTQQPSIEQATPLKMNHANAQPSLGDKPAHRAQMTQASQMSHLQSSASETSHRPTSNRPPLPRSGSVLTQIPAINRPPQPSKPNPSLPMESFSSVIRNSVAPETPIFSTAATEQESASRSNISPFIQALRARQERNPQEKDTDSVDHKAPLEEKKNSEESSSVKVQETANVQRPQTPTNGTATSSPLPSKEHTTTIPRHKSFIVPKTNPSCLESSTVQTNFRVPPSKQQKSSHVSHRPASRSHSEIPAAPKVCATVDGNPSSQIPRKQTLPRVATAARRVNSITSKNLPAKVERSPAVSQIPLSPKRSSQSTTRRTLSQKNVALSSKKPVAGKLPRSGTALSQRGGSKMNVENLQTASTSGTSSSTTGSAPKGQKVLEARFATSHLSQLEKGDIIEDNKPPHLELPTTPGCSKLVRGAPLSNQVPHGRNASKYEQRKLIKQSEEKALKPLEEEELKVSGQAQRRSKSDIRKEVVKLEKEGGITKPEVKVEVVKREEKEQLTLVEQNEVAIPNQKKELVKPDQKEILVKPEEKKELGMPNEKKELGMSTKKKALDEPNKRKGLIRSDEKKLDEPYERKELIRKKEKMGLIKEDEKELIDVKENMELVRPDGKELVKANVKVELVKADERNLVQPEMKVELFKLSEKEVVKPEQKMDVVKLQQRRDLVKPEQKLLRMGQENQTEGPEATKEPINADIKNEVMSFVKKREVWQLRETNELEKKGLMNREQENAAVNQNERNGISPNVKKETPGPSDKLFKKFKAEHIAIRRVIDPPVVLELDSDSKHCLSPEAKRLSGNKRDVMQRLKIPPLRLPQTSEMSIAEGSGVVKGDRKRPSPTNRHIHNPPLLSPITEEASRRFMQRRASDSKIANRHPGKACSCDRKLSDAFESELLESDLSPTIRPSKEDLAILEKIRRVGWSKFRSRHTPSIAFSPSLSTSSLPPRFSSPLVSNNNVTYSGFGSVVCPCSSLLWPNCPCVSNSAMFPPLSPLHPATSPVTPVTPDSLFSSLTSSDWAYSLILRRFIGTLGLDRRIMRLQQLRQQLRDRVLKRSISLDDSEDLRKFKFLKHRQEIQQPTLDSYQQRLGHSAPQHV